MPEFKEEIKSAVDAIREKAGAEIAEKIEDNLISIVTKTNSMVTSYKEQESEIKELRAEAYNKRHALKDFQKEVDGKIQDYEREITDLKASANDEEQGAELERLRNFEKETIELQRNDFKSFVENVKDDKKFPKVENRFKFPTNDDGIDLEAFDKMEYGDLKHNLAQMKDLKELEYFDSASSNINAPPAGGKAQRITNDDFNARLSQAKTRKEVTEIARAEGVIK